MIKTIVNLANLFVLGFFCFLLYDDGLPNRPIEFLVFFTFSFVPLITLYYVNFASNSSEKTYFGLIIERRKLEEKAKIDKLKAES